MIGWLYHLFETEPPCVTSGNRCPFTHLSSETILQVRKHRLCVFAVVYRDHPFFAEKREDGSKGLRRGLCVGVDWLVNALLA